MILIDDLKRDEGYRRHPYLDTAGKSTAGYGRNLDDLGISPEEAEYLLRSDIARVEGELDAALPWWRTLSDARRRALCNMCFNLGIPRLLGFKRTLGFLEAGKWDDAALAAIQSQWARQVGARATRIARLIREG